MIRSKLLFLYTETVCHAGGPSSVAAIDLPIQRDTTTEAPIIWGSSVKGAVKDHARNTLGWAGDDRLRRVLGGDPPDTTPGWAAFIEARVAAFPVPTYTPEPFAWVTSPMALASIARLARITGETTPDVPGLRADTTIAGDPARWAAPLTIGPFVTAVETDPTRVRLAGAWAEWLAGRGVPTGQGFDYFATKFRRDLLVVADDIYVELTRQFAPVATRVMLDPATKTVEQLFNEEYLPTDTLLVAVVADAGPAGGSGWDEATVDELLDGHVFTIGGSETVGAGLVWARTKGPAA